VTWPGPSGTGRDCSAGWVIWVDPKTELPVKITYEGTTLVGDKEPKLTKTIEGFSRNEKLDDNLFDTKVPDGYTEGTPGRVPPKK
jgi:hypothetical protein